MLYHYSMTVLLLCSLCCKGRCGVLAADPAGAVLPSRRPSPWLPRSRCPPLPRLLLNSSPVLPGKLCWAHRGRFCSEGCAWRTRDAVLFPAVGFWVKGWAGGKGEVIWILLCRRCPDRSEGVVKSHRLRYLLFCFVLFTSECSLCLILLNSCHSVSNLMSLCNKKY